MPRANGRDFSKGESGAYLRRHYAAPRWTQGSPDDAMKRTITIEADDYDLPVDLQAVQKTAATWNGQAVELTLKLMLALWLRCQ